jgi:hypothetical protein
VNGGSQHPDKRRDGGHGPTLADQVEHELLPTPVTGYSGRGADPARYKGPQSLNGRRSNLDDCIAAINAKSPWLLPPGDSTALLSADGSASPDGPRPGLPSEGEPASG